MRIDKSSFNNYEKTHIKELENLLFKTHNHCKRGQGIQNIPKHINKKEEFDYKKFLNNMYYTRFITIDKTKIKIISN